MGCSLGIILLMIDDFGGASSGGPRKLKRIEPLQKSETKSVLELAQQDSATDSAGTSASATFITPDAAAKQTVAPGTETVLSGTPQESAIRVSNNAATASHHTGFWTPRWTINKKWLIPAVLAVLLIMGGCAFAYLSKPTVKGGVYLSKRPPKPAPKDPRVPNTLTGLLVDPSINQRPVTGVMIENSLDARPQSGLNQAGVVFEAIAEGGITRFLAVFQDTEPDYIGPVRSARPYYVQWCMSFDCALAHAGGSPEALQNIGAWGTKDLNDAVGYFWRIPSRYAPHNLYTSTAKLHEYEAARGYGAPTFTGFARKADKPYKAPAAGKPATDTRRTATTINLAISSANFNARFDYDATSNSYARSQAGSPHMTIDGAGNQTQIKPRVVVALVLPYGIAYDGHSQYGTVGSGQAFVFQDGTASEAVWSKTDVGAPLKLTDAAGKDITLNAGQTWVTALGAANQVTY